MSMGLLNQVRFDRVKTAQSAATTDVTSDSVDMASDNGYRGVTFLVHFGAIVSGAATSVKLQGSDDDSTFSDLTGTSVTVADTDDDKMTVIDLYRPVHRYVRCIVDRGTQNATVDAITAIMYENNLEAVSQSTDVQGSELHVSPAAGTA